VSVSTSGAYPAGTTLYSVSTDANVSSHINVHVLSDLMVRSWYSAQSLNADSAFTNPVSGNAAPQPGAVQILAQPVIQSMQFWLSKAGVSATATAPLNGSIILISSFFKANKTGLDSLLDNISTYSVNSNTGAVSQFTVTGGTVTQTITPAYPSGSLTLTSTTTDSSSGATTTATASSVLPVTASLLSALIAINAQLTAFQDAVNNKGSSLAASDILPFYASDYVNDGINAAQDSDNTANSIVGVTLNSLQITGIDSFDVASNVADLILTEVYTIDGVKQAAQAEVIFKLENNAWLEYGDQRIASIAATAQSRTAQGGPSLGPGVSHGTYMMAEVKAPEGTVSGAKVSGGENIWSGHASGTLIEEATITKSGIQSPQRNGVSAGVYALLHQCPNLEVA
jgi:hypothetical protein